jgi:hypothetical protein
MRNYETPIARDAARMVRRGVFGYLLGYLIAYAVMAGIVLFVLGSFALLIAIST